MSSLSPQAKASIRKAMADLFSGASIFLKNGCGEEEVIGSVHVLPDHSLVARFLLTTPLVEIHFKIRSPDGTLLMDGVLRDCPHDAFEFRLDIATCD
jgi:hypothetical protein